MKKDRERKRQELLQRIRGFRLMDDEFMTKCFEDNVECMELVPLPKEPGITAA